MTEQIQIFKNPEFGEVRTSGNADNPTFCLSDVCKVLGLDPSQVMKRLDGGVVSIHPISDSLGRQQAANFVNEDGLYDVILDSRKPEAKKFRKWITSEVLPSIRRHGAYMTEQTVQKALTSPDFLIRLAQQLKSEQERNKTLTEQAEADRPKVVFADAIVGSKNSCIVGELAKILTDNGYKVGQNRLFKWLRNMRYLGAYGERYNIPNQQYIEQGLFELKKSVHSENGVMVNTVTPKVTPKGQQYFINGFVTGRFSLL